MNRTKSEKPTWQQIEQDRDEPVKLPVEPDEALRGLLAVDPEGEPADGENRAGGSQADR